MEEGLGYSEEDKKSKSSSQQLWQMGTASVLSIESQSSRSTLNISHLQLLQKREVLSDRPTIPATKAERLSYYRSYISSPSKMEIICMQNVRFNRFLWYYVFNVFGKSLPHTYVQIFLASYAPEEHLFLSKMVPICYGFCFSIIVASFVELVFYVDNALFLLDYVVRGILFKNPWNRCTVSSYTLPNNITVNCYELNDFAKKFMNDTPIFNYLFYVSTQNEYFQMAPIEYYKSCITRAHEKIFTASYAFYFLLIWILIAFHYNQLFKQYIWKAIHLVQYGVNAVYLIVFIHVMTEYFHCKLYNVSSASVPDDTLTTIMWKADIDMLSESMTAPPVVHVLTARSDQEIHPSSDSAIMITSNALYFIFRGVLSYRMKKYCEHLVGAPIRITEMNQHAWLYFWPIYFSTFLLGDLYTIVFFSLSFLMEFYTITITYQCLIEVIVCQWKWTERWAVTSVITLSGLFTYWWTTPNARVIIYIMTTGLTTMVEIFLIYIMYPLDRLLDDITFHYGTAPTKLRILNLRIVPIYYAIKLYTMFNALVSVIKKHHDTEMLDLFSWCWSLVVVPILLGTLYPFYKYVWIRKRNWKTMFSPDKDWGPKDFFTKQLRKHFDSGKYVGSQDPRILARYILSKVESKVYRLDVPYDSTIRRSMAPSTETHHGKAN